MRSMIAMIEYGGRSLEEEEEEMIKLYRLNNGSEPRQMC